MSRTNDWMEINMYIIGVLLAAAGVIFRRPKILGIASFYVLGLLSAYSNPLYNPDYSVYSGYYTLAGQGVNTTYFEQIYMRLGILAYDHGLSYMGFRLAMVMIFTTVLIFGILRFTDNVAFVALSYALTSFFINDVQIRNFFMLTIVVVAFSVLKKITVKRLIIALALIYVSAGFHSVAYVFLFTLVFLLFRDTKTGIYVVSTVVVFIQLIMVFAGKELLLSAITTALSRVTQRINLAEKISQQFITGPSYVYILLSWVMVFASIMFVLFVLEHEKDSVLLTENQVLIYAFLTATLGLPMMMYATDYTRIIRNSFFFLYLFAAIIFKDKNLEVTSFYKKVMWLVVIIASAVGQNVVWGPAFVNDIPHLAHFFNGLKILQ